MNSTLHDADRATHMRVVTSALIAAIVVSGLAISMRLSAGGAMQANMNTSALLKADLLRCPPPQIDAGQPLSPFFGAHFLAKETSI